MSLVDWRFIPFALGLCHQYVVICSSIDVDEAITGFRFLAEFSKFAVAVFSESINFGNWIGFSRLVCFDLLYFRMDG